MQQDGLWRAQTRPVRRTVEDDVPAHKDVLGKQGLACVTGHEAIYGVAATAVGPRVCFHLRHTGRRVAFFVALFHCCGL